MTPRVRAAIFFSLAAIAALTGALIVGRYRDGALEPFGELRPVLMSTASLPEATPIDARIAARRTDTRQVPERFVPADALAIPGQAIGLAAATDLPPGTYLTRSNLSAPHREGPRRDPRLTDGRRPVEIQVNGAGALAEWDTDTAGASGRVDVVVTTDPSTGGPGRTYVAAAQVPLLSVRATHSEVDTGTAGVLLGLTRREALALIQAEAFARSVRVLPVPERLP